MELIHTLRKAELRLFGSLFRLNRKRLVMPLAKALSHSGDGYLHILVALLLLLMQPPAWQNLLMALAFALTVERTLYYCLKNSLKRQRPAARLPGFRSIITASDQFSFPSGHSSGAFLLATVLWLAYGEFSAVLYLWASGVALSRVVLGVHFPGDIVAGALMGSSIAALGINILVTQGVLL